MRSLGTFGSIALFLGMAFVNPSKSLITERVAFARSQSSMTTAAVASTVFSSVVPTPRKIVSRVTHIVSPHIPRSHEWKSLLSNEKNPLLKDALESIDWAQRTSDVQLCRGFDSSFAKTTLDTAPTRGDLLALCLAKVSGNDSRCRQIDPRTAYELKAVCETELVGRT